MKKIPKASNNPFIEIAKSQPELLPAYMSLHSPVDKKGRYLPFDELYRRFPKALDTQLAWSVVRDARQSQLSKLAPFNQSLSSFDYFVSSTIQKTNIQVEQHTSLASLEWMSQQLGEGESFKYVLDNLVKDEAISSSQLEGAATTTRVARDFLLNERKPESLSEKMIFGNFNLMQAAWSEKDKPLSLALIKQLHHIGMSDIDDEKYQPGYLRTSDDVVVVDASGQVVHTPPLASELEQRLEFVVTWFNNTEPDSSSSAFVIATALHFAIGFEHPFHDGNGRLARALFYWVMFKHGYHAFRYISISALLNEAPVQYGKSYIHTETDEMDMTYFIEYQSKITSRAVDKFLQDFSEMAEKYQSFKELLATSKYYAQANEKQRTVIMLVHNIGIKKVTANWVQGMIDCSYNTAASILNGLTKIGIFERGKVGREWHYSMLNLDGLAL
ncbi:MAG: Fic family protein [Oleispira sp.]